MQERPNFSRYEAVEADEDVEAINPKIKEAIETIKSECAHVYDDPEIKSMMNQLVSDAKEFGDVDPAGWEKLLIDTKRKILSAEDDSDAVEGILREALTTGTTELM